MLTYNRSYPAVQDLKIKAKQRIPGFAFDYLEGGCNDEVNLARNETDFHDVQLMPQYLKKFGGTDTSAEIFGHRYDAPFGVSPIGLQGLMWPGAPQILAKAAYQKNIPFTLSTVSTASIEDIAAVTQGNFWFQLYHPRENTLTDDILQRLENSGCKVLVLLIDVPSFGLRYREIKAGLSMPPKMTVNNILQAVARPSWSINTLRQGIPEFATLKKYMTKSMSMRQLGAFMNATFTGRVDVDKVAAIRDKWKGKLVLKGVASEADAEKAIELGVDGMLISNHGGRQLDAGESTIQSLKRLAPLYGKKITMMLDSGVRSGPDIARAIACGADFVFMGRPFMYGVAALGKQGGDHTIEMYKAQFKQVMEQLCCHNISELPETLIR